MKLATKLKTALLLLCAATAASANPFPGGNAVNGQKLFEQYKCNSCHDTMMGGDGNKIFTRLTRKVSTPDSLIDQIGMCSGNVNAHLTAQQKQDLAAYLNNYYKFK
ncbi:MAG: cytochrome c [Nitrosomonadales bacterium]|nr:cytochrome c [Nitrosomonadales bacterium]